LKLNKFIILIFAFIFSLPVFSQRGEDAIRLSKLSYMQISNQINCDSTSGSNLELKICLNKEFQKLDSIMNSLFTKYTQSISSDTTKNAVIEFQTEWVKNRHLQSVILSDGYQGNMASIYYLKCMNISTKLRIEELEALLNLE